MQNTESPDIRRVRKQAREKAERVRQFMNFAGVYLAVGLFFLLINIFGGLWPLWFFWPLIPMTIPLVILAWRAFALSRFDDDWVDDQVERRTAQPTVAAGPKMNPSTEIDAIAAEAAELIDGMRRSAR